MQNHNIWNIQKINLTIKPVLKSILAGELVLKSVLHAVYWNLHLVKGIIGGLGSSCSTEPVPDRTAMACGSRPAGIKGRADQTHVKEW